MRFVMICFALTSFLLALSGVTAPVAKSDGITEEQATAILNELKQIRLLLEKQQTQPIPVRAAPIAEKVKLANHNAYAIGSSDAPLTLVEFTDYQCPFCNKFHTTTFPELKKHYIETGKVRFVSRDLPLDFHKNAFQAARAARCAGEQGKYWEVRDRLSSNPNNLGQDGMLHYAKEAGVDATLFQACIDSDRYKAEVQKDIEAAQSVGISGTPAFILGRTSTDEFEGIKIVGAQPYATFEARINELLATVKEP